MAVSISELPARQEAEPAMPFFARLGTFCGTALYALVALGLRLLMARAFFLAGQTKIAGPSFTVPLIDGSFSITLPAEIKETTFELFAKQYAALPVSPTLAAWLFSYAEFVLPICLVLGFATRLSALGLLAITVLVQIYVAPEAFWTVEAYAIGILSVLVSVGPGALSADGLIRHLYRT